ncbi:MAG: response regulator [Bacteroidetes bacterium]|nr:response regulator [Bacteroidota bacterium]
METPKPRILIVDDNSRNIQVVANILSADNMDIAFATSGQRALELVANQQFDLILLDIMMPGMDGFAVCRELRTNPQTSGIPVIFLTARNYPSSILLGFSTGANDYVTKPFNSAELKARVHTHLELYRRRKELQHLNQHLESLVRERTRELEAAMRQLSRLEKSKSEFLSIISHELRGPLSGIIGMAEILKTSINDSALSEQLLMLSQIAGRLSRFAEMALLITSLKSNGDRLTTMPTLAHIPVEMAVAECAPLLAEKQIRIELFVDAQDVVLHIDPEMIRRCLGILIEHASANLPRQSEMQLRLESTENQATISLITKGMNFPDELIQTVNDHMLIGQLISEETTGLSLAAVKLILDAQNGRMQLCNKGSDGCVKLIFEKDNNDI